MPTHFKLNLISIWVVIIALSACSYLQEKPIFKPNIVVTMEAQDRIRFAGKGAGAGMMMSSTMGAMGIAIGVAIDEGIGKDIHSAFEAAGGNFARLITDQTEDKLVSLCSESAAMSLCKPESVIEVKVRHYGFVLASGENDPIKPDLDIVFVANGKENALASKNADLSEFYIALEDAKQDGESILASLRAAYSLLLDDYIASLSE